VTHVKWYCREGDEVAITNDIAGGPWWHNAAVRSDTVLLRARRLNLEHAKFIQIMHYCSTFGAIADLYDLDKANY
jgi:hypothetical protein